MKQRWPEGAVLVASVLFAIHPVAACSLVGCLNDGIEMRGDFAVVVKHDGKPLNGVDLEVSGNGIAAGTTIRAAQTGRDGRAMITGLPPGEYWLNVKMLGISATYHCFHVAQRPTSKAKRRVSYDWGDLAASVSHVSGKLVDPQPGTSGNPLWNLTHISDVPIAGARLTLRNAVTGETFATTSDEKGEFAFGILPSGTYVLHAEGSRGGRGYEATDLLLKVSKTAKTSEVVLKRQEPSGTNCGDSSLYPSWK